MNASWQDVQPFWIRGFFEHLFRVLVVDEPILIAVDEVHGDLDPFHTVDGHDSRSQGLEPMQTGSAPSPFAHQLQALGQSRAEGVVVQDPEVLWRRHDPDSIEAVRLSSRQRSVETTKGKANTADRLVILAKFSGDLLQIFPFPASKREAACAIPMPAAIQDQNVEVSQEMLGKVFQFVHSAISEDAMVQDDQGRSATGVEIQGQFSIVLNCETMGFAQLFQPVFPFLVLWNLRIFPPEVRKGQR